MKREIVAQGAEIYALIPQRPPIVMVDKFYGITGNSSYSGLTVTPDNIFCQNGKLQETGIVEFVAQSAAARIGYINSQKKELVLLGFIGSVDKMKIYYLPPIDAELFAEITVIQEVADITLIEACVKVTDCVVATCRMKIFLKKDGKETK
ncbi:hydroxymyristoyl-ACP dehydratase [uncultured Bacteroides sp.]|uniref:hydroxymyristoyl-ACP dehydratase n=1 Tax=uncultured Bacteroides sp. TaxID=162156 RepID=UPI002AAC1A1D|nr:hydroxymyristoyl-ACP dehydratase [uncultured Bacteroides sp.]